MTGAEASQARGQSYPVGAAGGPAPAEPPEGEDGSEDADPLVRALQDPAQRKLLIAFRKRMEGPEETEEEDGRNFYHLTGTLLRYLRARKWDIQAAEDMLRNTGRWRKATNFAGLMRGDYRECIAEENDCGKSYVRGFDKTGRPAIVCKPRYESSFEPVAIIRHLVYNIERALACLERQLQEGKLAYDAIDPASGKFILVIGFGDISMRNMIPFSVCREILTVLQDHYPERLGQAIMFDAPWVMNALFNAVWPFIDPVTQKKFQLVSEQGKDRSERLRADWDLSQLEPEFGGTADTPFQSHVFLNIKTGGTEFGLDFNAQWDMAQEEAAKGTKLSSADQAALWRLYADPRVMALSREERSLVRELARLLCTDRDDTVEEHYGLYDNAGALIRYLCWQDWNCTRAEEKLRATATWRKEFGLAAQRDGEFSEVIARENKSGKMYVRGFDRRGRPIVYVKLSSRDSGRREDTLRHMVYCMERAIACLEARRRELKTQRFGFDEADSEAARLQEADERITFVVDFKGYSRYHRPALDTIHRAVNILQEHYPERLGEAYFMWPPLRVNVFWKAIRQMVNPATYAKVILVRDSKHHAQLLAKVFERTNLERSVGGDGDAPFDSQVFLNRQVNGDVYGTEFDAQLSTCSPNSSALPPRRVCFAENSAVIKEENETMGWTFNLECLFGGSNSSLW